MAKKAEVKLNSALDNVCAQIARQASVACVESLQEMGVEVSEETRGRNRKHHLRKHHHVSLMKTYITFGQDHAHRVEGKTFDCDCVACIKHPEGTSGHTIAMELFAGKFSFSYTEDTWKGMEAGGSLSYYPRGILTINQYDHFQEEN